MKLILIALVLAIAGLAYGQCQYGPYGLEVNGRPLTNLVLTPNSMMKSSLPHTFYITLPPKNQRPDGSVFMLDFSATLQASGDFCYTVALGGDYAADCLGVSDAGTVNTTWSAVLDDEDDVMGVATAWCGKACTAPIKYSIGASVRVIDIPPFSPFAPDEVAQVDKQQEEGQPLDSTCTKEQCCIRNTGAGCTSWDACSVSCPGSFVARCTCNVDLRLNCGCSR